MMSDLRMALVNAAINLAVQDHAHPNASSDGYVYEACFALRGAAICFSEGSGVSVIFYGNWQIKLSPKKIGRVSALPGGQIMYVRKLAGKRVNLSGAANSNSVQAASIRCRALGESCTYAVHGAVKSARYIGGKFSFSEHAPLIVYHSYRNLRTPDIDGSDHARHLSYFLMAMRSNSERFY